ncbi:MAG TPA: DUF1501 domain-containing protein [Solirubrobacteraceae bacterium]|nr:DUF1501 domain-containing protein [Solirubrobacteraceae bacterium]
MPDPTFTACGCAGFSRSELLRGGAAATAGRGLRAIEAGMPLPAGTGLSRRSFLARASGLALAVFGGAALGPRAFEAGIAAAEATGEQRVLVLIFCSGGLDSLSLLAPVGDARYATLRGALALSADPAYTFAEDTRLRWHPNAAPLRDLHAAGKLSVIPAIGYADANQSHFTSRHYWEVGAIDPAGRVGWLGRYLDRHGAADNPLQGLSLDYTLAPALATADVPVAAVASPESYDLWARDVWDDAMFDAAVTRWGGQGALATADPELATARRAAGMSTALRTQLAELQGHQGAWQNTVAYPASQSDFPERLASLAEMIGRGLPLRVVALDANGGYDTHENQAATLQANLSLLSSSLAAFQADLEARGVADRVLVHVWSEFGRRPEANGSGTDHGAGGASLVMGTQAKGAMVGEFPGLATLDAQSNLRHTVDFRAVYKGLAEQWLGVSADGIVPGASGFTAPQLVR